MQDLSTVSTARSLSNDGLVEVSATGDAGGVREQPVAQPELKFSVHEVKQHVVSLAAYVCWHIRRLLPLVGWHRETVYHIAYCVEGLTTHRRNFNFSVKCGS